MDPSVNIKSPKQEDPVKFNFFTSEELREFMDAIDLNAVIDERNRIIFETYYSLGLRLHEALNLKLNDFNTEDDFIHIRITMTESRMLPVVNYLH